MKVKRTERGWAGHFFCAQRCQFKRNTLLEMGELRIVISTVGALVIDDKFTTIRCNRHYETMAFMAEKDGIYWDANVEKEIEVDRFAIADIESGSDQEANDMHEHNVKDIKRRMKNEEITLS